MAAPASVPETDTGVGNLLGVVEGFFQVIVEILVLGVAITALLAISWGLYNILDAARRSKPTMNWKRGMALGLFASQRAPNRGMTPWVMVGLGAIVGAGVLAFVMYILNEAINVF